MSTESTDLDLHFAAPPPDSAEPGEGVRYLLDQAAFLADLPARINFRIRVRMLLREGRFGEALLAALAYDARTLQLRGASDENSGRDARAPNEVRADGQRYSDSPDPHSVRGSSVTSPVSVPINPLDQSWR